MTFMTVFGSLAHWFPSYTFKKKKSGGGQLKTRLNMSFHFHKEIKRAGQRRKEDATYIIQYKNERAQSLADLTIDRVPVLFPSISCARNTTVWQESLGMLKAVHCIPASNWPSMLDWLVLMALQGEKNTKEKIQFFCPRRKKGIIHPWTFLKTIIRALKFN